MYFLMSSPQGSNQWPFSENITWQFNHQNRWDLEEVQKSFAQLSAHFIRYNRHACLLWSFEDYPFYYSQTGTTNLFIEGFWSSNTISRREDSLQFQASNWKWRCMFFCPPVVIETTNKHWRIGSSDTLALQNIYSDDVWPCWVTLQLVNNFLRTSINGLIIGKISETKTFLQPRAKPNTTHFKNFTRPPLNPMEHTKTNLTLMEHTRAH